jgi:hypothetical protein
MNMDPAFWKDVVDSSQPPTEAPSRSSTDTNSFHSGRARSHISSTRPDEKRKFSLAARLKPTTTRSWTHSRDRRKELALKLEALLLRVPDVVDKDTGKSMRGLAMEDLQTLPTKVVLACVEEYTKIPRPKLRLKEMLEIKTKHRTAISESVKKARAALNTRINTEWEQIDEEEAMLYSLRAKLDKKDKQPSRQGTEISEATLYHDYAAISNNSENFSSQAHDKSLSRVATSISTFSETITNSNLNLARTYTSQSQDKLIDCHRGDFPSLWEAATFGRVAQEVGASEKHAPITTAVLKAITPPNSRASTAQGKAQFNEVVPKTQVAGIKEPCKENPFASFITEKSEVEAEKLPDELHRCYVAHNKVQDQMRQLWRQNKAWTSAEEIAKEVWDSLPRKDHPVGYIFEEQYQTTKPLNKEELEYIWVMQFWERCRARAW